MPRTATDLPDYLSGPDTVLPEPFAPDDMAARIADLHRQSGGATFNPFFGDMSGQRLYAVSVFPSASAVESGRFISPMFVRGFIQEHQSLLLDPLTLGHGTISQRMRHTLMSRRLYRTGKMPSPWPFAIIRSRFTIWHREMRFRHSGRARI